MPVQSRLLQPSSHAPLRLGMGDGTALFNGSFPTRHTFQQAHPALQGLKCRDIDQIRTRHSVLRDQDRLSVALQLRQEFRGLALEGRHEFGTHEVILEHHFSGCRWRTRPNYRQIAAICKVVTPEERARPVAISSDRLLSPTYDCFRLTPGCGDVLVQRLVDLVSRCSLNPSSNANFCAGGHCRISVGNLKTLVPSDRIPKRGSGAIDPLRTPAYLLPWTVAPRSRSVASCP